MIIRKIFALNIILVSLMLAQSAGETGFSFLKNGFGARNISMGDFGVVSANDLTALYYNPSLLAVNKKSQIAFSHNSLFNDLSSEMLGASFSVFNLPFAVGVNTTKINDIEVRTKPGDPQATFNANYFSASISSALSISDNIFVGSTIKYIYENIYTDESTGFGFDLGIVYQNFFDNLSLGASLKNIGKVSALKNESAKLPSDVQLGISYNYSLSYFDFNILSGIQKFIHEDKFHSHFGAEIIYNKYLALRFGYLTGYDSKNFSTGLGVLFKNFNFDYAYVPVKYGLGDNHIITITYTFN